MKTIPTIAMALAMGVLAPVTGYAATLTDGVYAAFDMDDNGIDRGVWSKSMVDGYTSGEEKLWSFAPGATFTVSNGGTEARLEGSASNVDTPSLSFLFDITFSHAPSGNPGYCQFNGTPDPDCDNAHSQNLIANNVIDPTAWSYFDIVAGQFTGTGAMTGLSYSVTDKTGGNHRPQVGESANALTIGNNGMSFWYNFTLDGGATSQNGYTFNGSGSGDFNFDIGDTPVVPLPAAGWLLLAGIGGLVAAKRRQKA